MHLSSLEGKEAFYLNGKLLNSRCKFKFLGIPEVRERLSGESRGRQCSFASLTALFFHEYCPANYNLFNEANKKNKFLICQTRRIKQVNCRARRTN